MNGRKACGLAKLPNVGKVLREAGAEDKDALRAFFKRLE